MNADERKEIRGLMGNQKGKSALVFGVTVLIVLLLQWPGWHSPKLYADSWSYLEHNPVRPPVYCVFLDVVGSGPVLPLVQSALSAVCWCGLGWTLAGLAGGALLGLFALTYPIAQWNLLALSESLTLSLLAGCLALTVRLARCWRWREYGLWCLAAGLLAFTRLSNFYVLPALVAPFVLRPWRQWGALLAAVLLLGCMHLLFMQTPAGVWMHRVWITNVVMSRILPDPASRAEFAAQGMPTNAAVLRHAGRMRGPAFQELWNDSPDFERWISTRGLSAYRRWLIARRDSYREAWSVMIYHLRNKPPFYAKDMFIPRWVRHNFRLYDLMAAPTWLWIVSLVLPLGLAWRWERRNCILAWLIVACALAGYGQAFLCYHAEPDEVRRHILLSGVLYRVVFLFGAIAALSLLVGRWRSSALWLQREEPPR
jgi:hypothetical protein